MTAYVAGFMLDYYGNVALVRKSKPVWQQGLLNGIGGKIERRELPITAMIREWYEETGNYWTDWRSFATLRFDDAVVYFYSARCDELPPFAAANDVGEPIEVHAYNDVQHEAVIPNLKWLLPLAFEDPAKPNVEARCFWPPVGEAA